MEIFCQYRHSLGLAASSLNVYPIQRTGYVAENREATMKLKYQGHFSCMNGLLDFLGLSILVSNPHTMLDNRIDIDRSWVSDSHIVMGLHSEIHLDDPSNRATWRRDRRMGFYHNVSSQRMSQVPSGWSEPKNFLTRVQDLPDLLD